MVVACGSGGAFMETNQVLAKGKMYLFLIQKST